MSGGRVYNGAGELIGELEGHLQFDAPQSEAWEPVSVVMDCQLRFDPGHARRLREWMNRALTPTRTLDLRRQLKRKGKPGWKRMRVRK